jgi:prevent-host-death family protein
MGAYAVTNSNTSRLASPDVHPVTEFRAHASAFLDHVRATKRALILTQHGRSAAVLLDMAVWEELLDELAALREATSPEPMPPQVRSSTT